MVELIVPIVLTIVWLLSFLWSGNSDKATDTVKGVKNVFKTIKEEN